MAGLKNQVGSITAQAVALRNYIAENPDRDESELMEQLRIKRHTLYSILNGLAGQDDICPEGKFRVLTDGQRLTTQMVEEVLLNSTKKPGDKARQAERLLYLYNSLHSAIPYGGLTLDSIIQNYKELMDQGKEEQQEAALKRMIYRDLQHLESIGIGIERPATGNRRYCLRERYLPKLTPDSAAAVYVSMLLFRNTLLDKATSGAKQEIEKTFFKNKALPAGLFEDRIYVLGDTLAHPKEYGDILGKLIRSVLESFKIKITYIKNSGEVSDRLLHPVGMVCKRNVWYVIALVPDSGEYRTFRVDQIISILGYENETFAYPEGFTLNGHIGSSWGVFCNDTVQTVRLKFSPRVAHRVKNLRYHPTQEIVEDAADGSVVLQFKVCGLLELRTWIIQWGTEVEVLEPSELRNQIRQMAEDIVKIYLGKNTGYC